MSSKANKTSNLNTNFVGELFIVATPIGNLKDLTFRAVDILSSVALVACEDTRNTQRLLNHYGIKAKTIAYHDHSSEKEREKILRLLAEGMQVAIVSDSGTPLISDPGYKLVSIARSRGIKVTPIPGASSLIAALCASGMPTDSFKFIGFLPKEEGNLARTLESIKQERSTTICFESPKRLMKTLDLLTAVLEERNIAVARELTKLHEEIITGSIQVVHNHFAAKEIKGEIVILIEGRAETQLTEMEITNLLKAHLKDTTLKTAVDEVATATGISKKEVYRLALAIKADLA